MRIGIIGIISNPSKRFSSHNAGWNFVYRSMLEQRYNCAVDILTAKDDWDKYDHLWISEGVNYRPGVWNLFGGVTDALKKRLHKLSEYEGELLFWGDIAPIYQNLCDNRNIDIFVYKEITIVKNIIESNKIILGDSHSVSVYQPKWHISRNDGKTLNFFSNQPYEVYEEMAVEYNTIRFYAGNIDIRHHFCRLYEDIDLYDKIDTMVNNLSDRLSIFENVEVVAPLRSPLDSRRIPKTGYYKKHPFYGSHASREEARAILHMSLKKHFKNVLEWPETVHLNDVLLSSAMEAKQSVHLAPSAYMFKNELFN